MRASNQVELSTEFLANKTIYEQGAVDRKGTPPAECVCLFNKADLLDRTGGGYGNHVDLYEVLR